MAIWSKNSNSSNNQMLGQESGMIGGLSVDAHPADRRMSGAGSTQAADMTVKDYMTGMPTIRLTSLFKGLMRQIIWIIPVFIAGCFLIYLFTKDIKRTYRADGRLLVQIGPEYIYTPIGASNATNNQGVAQTPDTIALNEVGIMKNSKIINEVIGIMTTPTGDMAIEEAQDLFADKAFEKIREAEAKGDQREVEDAWAKLREAVNSAYYVAPKPKSSIIDVSYKHENPDVAIQTLNQFIASYIDHRQILFVEGSEDTISERLRETERLLKKNELAIARFLERNDISDFTSEQDGLRERSEDLKAELNTLRGEISETEGSLARVEDQLRGTQPTINLYIDDRASQRVAQAELELKQLLAKYLPTSDPVRQKQTELNELKALQSSNNGRAAGGRRVGPNPNYQELVTSRNTLQATANSYREKEVTLQGQLNSAVDKVRRLTQLSPEHQNLLRERETLSAALVTYNARSQEAAVNAAQAEANNENIKVISKASFAVKGQNIGKLIWAGGSLAWGLTLLMLALLRVFLDPKNFSAPSTSRRESRRSRSTDKPGSNGGGIIPEPLAPYAPRTPMTATAMDENVVEATRAYNATAKATSAKVIAADQPKHYPEEYNSGEYQGVNYQGVGFPGYGNPDDYYPPAHNADELARRNTETTSQAYVSNQQANIDMQANPYLNMQPQGGPGEAAQTNDLPVLGSFSAAKG